NLKSFLCDELSAIPNDKFHVPDSVWVEIIYAFASAYHKKIINREHLLKSLTPLYIGRVASFVIETYNSNATEVENKIENLCIMFEHKKNTLIDTWD
ncbi:MAG: hypothetical protein KAQ85_05780, partial [Thermodesulfovibrionia bacterium]|nr:hypothetical protein [Thermodesulfovibrionia bacterium]